MAIVAFGVGGLWIGQGVGAVHGSFMTGHSQYTGLGIALVVFGLVMLAWAATILGRRRSSAG